MDLAAMFRRPLGELRHSLSERELNLWAAYAAKKALPARRAEFYWAQLALCVMRAAGAEGLKLADFLFDPQTDEPQEPEDELESAKLALDFKPRKVKTNGG
jgi:hypothetical protein